MRSQGDNLLEFLSDYNAKRKGEEPVLYFDQLSFELLQYEWRKHWPVTTPDSINNYRGRFIRLLHFAQERHWMKDTRRNDHQGRCQCIAHQLAQVKSLGNGSKKMPFNDQPELHGGDPVSANLSNPQSLHRYAYVLNNPLIGIDPLGLECVFVSDDGQGIDEVDPTGQNYNYDSASCGQDGGLYFEGNDEVNFDTCQTTTGCDWSVYQDSWDDNFDVDMASNWVGLHDDNGNVLGAACNNAGGGDCGISL